jgi:hypothetical protein
MSESRIEATFAQLGECARPGLVKVNKTVHRGTSFPPPQRSRRETVMIQLFDLT